MLVYQRVPDMAAEATSGPPRGARLSDAELLRFVQDLSQDSSDESVDRSDATALGGSWSCMALEKTLVALVGSWLPYGK